MAQEATPIDINHNPPTLQDATETVVSTGQRVPIQRDGKPVAYLVPADQAVQHSGNSNQEPSAKNRYPTIASLAGAAGTLPTPLSWGEMLEIAGEAQIEQAIRSHPAGIIAATAGRVKTDQPVRSAEELRVLAEDAIAADVAERS